MDTISPCKYNCTSMCVNSEPVSGDLSPALGSITGCDDVDGVINSVHVEKLHFSINSKSSMPTVVPT